MKITQAELAEDDVLDFVKSPREAGYHNELRLLYDINHSSKSFSDCYWPQLTVANLSQEYLLHDLLLQRFPQTTHLVTECPRFLLVL